MEPARMSAVCKSGPEPASRSCHLQASACVDEGTLQGEACTHQEAKHTSGQGDGEAAGRDPLDPDTAPYQPESQQVRMCTGSNGTTYAAQNLPFF